ncbi:MAG: hypothetical protein QNI90_11365 [Dinoroseobacter sp.]|nr:hypothetical protein [Dinoroseobacter sp.]
MRTGRNTIVAAALTVLVGCGVSWETSYEPIAQEVTQDWALGSVNVDVPLSLSAGEANVFAPSTDIVWQEELLPVGTTRHAQVDEIMTEAITRGASGLNGTRPIDLNVEVTRFHAISDYARVRLVDEGVHDIKFLLEIVDAETGEVLVPEAEIRTDLAAFVGQESIDALAAGITQRIRITDHVAASIAGLLGTGPDNRNTFRRFGR